MSLRILDHSTPKIKHTSICEQCCKSKIKIYVGHRPTSYIGTLLIFTELKTATFPRHKSSDLQKYGS